MVVLRIGIFSGTTTNANARAEFDITNVNATGSIAPNTTSTQVNITGTGDTIYTSAVGLQIDLAEARLTAEKICNCKLKRLL